MVRKIAKETLNALGFPDGELSLSFVTDQEITALNQKHLFRPRHTDVLAFSMREGDFIEINPSLLGDVVISVETAKKQADAKGHVFEEELCLLLIHGILHLLGYEHEIPGPPARAMRKKENELFSLMRAKVL
jgi:conserved hypothetical protein TIGR00043